MYEKVKNCTLFSGLDEQFVRRLMTGLGARVVPRAQGSTMLGRAFENKIAVLLSGTAVMEQTDVWGNRYILNRLQKDDVMGVGALMGESWDVPTDITFITESELLLLDIDRFKKLLIRRPETAFVYNLLEAVARRNKGLIGKSLILGQRTTRDKLLLFFSERVKEFGSDEFEIMFSRQGMADYLAVDRSALSKELSKMRDEGLIEFKRNKFKVNV